MQSVVWEAVPYFEKALELDQNNSDAHNGLALFNEWIKWDYIQAEKEFLKAIEISPKAQWLIFSRNDWEIRHKVTPFYKNVTREGILL
jgi:tetratricopeptide (TPR) repeat protein